MNGNGKHEDRIILAANGSHVVGGQSGNHGQPMSTPAPSNPRALRDRLGIALATGVLLLAGAAGGIAAWSWFHGPVPATKKERVVLSYGDPGQVHFRTRTLRAGEKTSVCFDGVYWHEICRSEMIYNTTCYKKAQFGSNVVELSRTDFPLYQISVPQNVGAVTPKCRPFVVPDDCLPGPLTHTGFVRHECGEGDKRETLYTPVPTFSAEIVE